MKFSVVIPTRNRAALVERAIRSVLAQTHRDFEVVVVDDGSTDGTGERIRAAFGRELEAGILRYHRNGRNLERSASRNLGVAMAAGEWIALLDDDDFFLPFHLQAHRSELERRPELDLLVSDGFTIDAGDLITPPSHAIPARRDGGCPDLVFADWILWGSASVFRKAMFERLGGFIEGLSFNEDRELFWRAAMSHRFGYIPLPTICRMVHRDSYLHQAPREELARCRETVLRRTEESARRFGYRIPRRIRGGAWLGAADIRQHDPAAAWRNLRKALGLHPPLLFSPLAVKLVFRLLAGERFYRRVKGVFDRFARRRPSPPA